MVRGLDGVSFGTQWRCAVLKGPEKACALTVSGGYGEGETPLPIPNRAVKPLSADGTWPARARESRTPPDFSRRLGDVWTPLTVSSGVRCAEHYRTPLRPCQRRPAVPDTTGKPAGLRLRRFPWLTSTRSLLTSPRRTTTAPLTISWARR